jgi:hypothetical protein
LSKSTVLAGLLVLATACGPNRSSGNGGDDGTDGNNNGGGDAATCASSMVKADKIPLDLFIMLDQSGSMTDTVAGGGTKWSAVTGALDAFVQQPGLDGVSVGLQYFGVPPGGGTCSVLSCNADPDCGASACGPCVLNVCLGLIGGVGQDSCNAADYAVAAVEIAPLPGVAAAITQSISVHSPTTSTPTSAALQGAIDHASTWAHSHPNDAVVVVFATDGDPSECDTSLPDIDAIAAAGAAATPKVLTFVIGVGSSLANLNGIAAAGGTMSAFLVDTGGNVNQQFLDALNNIRHAALGCQYTIPLPTDGSPPNYQEVNVVYTPGGGGMPRTIPYVMDKANCPMGGDGWYYDDPNNPMEIILCDQSCTTVEADMTGEVDITLGCSTVIL